VNFVAYGKLLYVLSVSHVDFRFLFDWPVFLQITPHLDGFPRGLRGEPLGIAEAGFFTGWMPFPSPNEQYHSTKAVIIHHVSQFCIFLLELK